MGPGPAAADRRRGLPLLPPGAHARRPRDAVPAWRRLVFALGLALAFLAVASPIHELGEQEFFFVHMLQHILLGDLAPLCMVAG